MYAIPSTKDIKIILKEKEMKLFVQENLNLMNVPLLGRLDLK